jgi:hypothetical protein
LTYTPLPDATPESELDALASIYEFILERHRHKKAADATGDRDEVKEVEHVDPRQRLP